MTNIVQVQKLILTEPNGNIEWFNGVVVNKRHVTIGTSDFIQPNLSATENWRRLTLPVKIVRPLTKIVFKTCLSQKMCSLIKISVRRIF